MHKYKGVIFDFNGTLFFDNPKHILAWSKISQDIRHHGIDEEELHEHINGVPNNKVVYLFCRSHVYHLAKSGISPSASSACSEVFSSGTSSTKSSVLAFALISSSTRCRISSSGYSLKSPSITSSFV